MPATHPALLDPVRYADLARSMPGLIAYWRLRDASGTLMRDELSRANGTYIGSPTLAQGSPVDHGLAVKFNGTTQAGSAAVDLSAYAQASIAFWLWGDAWSLSGDHYACEYPRGGLDGFYAGSGPNRPGGFFVGQKASTATLYVGFAGYVSSASKYWYDTFPAPSAAAWHHYVCTFNRATPLNTVYVDGVLQTLTLVGHDAVSYGNFANDTLTLMARGPIAGSPWPTNPAILLAGRMSEYALFGGVILTGNQARALYNAGVGR